MEAEQRTEEPAARRPNRRTAPRFAVDEDASLLLVNQGARMACTLLDLSLTGCRLRTQERFLAGIQVRVEVHFKVRGFAFRFSGVTQWTDRRHLAGIRFVDLPARRRDELAEALSEIEVACSNQPGIPSSPAAGQAQIGVHGPAPALILVRPTSSAPQKPAAPAEKLISAPSRLSQGTGRDRRVLSRLALDTSAVLHLVKIGSRLRGQILDLSLHGCRIRTDDRFPVGIYTRVEAEFRLDGLPLRLGGVTQAIHDRHQVGIRFLDMSPRKREQVVQLIEEMDEARRGRDPDAMASSADSAGEG